MISAFLIISITIGSLSALSYLQVKDEISGAYTDVMDQTDGMIREAMVLVMGGWPSIDEEMYADPTAIIERHIINASGSSKPDTRTLEQQLGELYGSSAEISVDVVDVIDLPDAAKFGRVWPEWQESSTNDGEISRSAYILMPGGMYLLSIQIRLPEDEKIPALYQYYTVRRAQEINPMLESVRVFDSDGHFVMDFTEPRNSSDETIPPTVLEEILITGSDTGTADPATHTTTRYLMIDAGPESREPWIVAVTYNLQKQYEEINAVLMLNLATCLLGIFFGAFVILGLLRYIGRPINAIVDDVEIIARGDLDHRIRETDGLEFSRLEQSINLMVRHLKETIERLKESEETVRIYSGNLEGMVEKRTEQLQLANEEVNLYIDILLHDINNANTMTLAYLELLKEDLSGEQRQYAEHALQGAKKSVAIIKNVGTIRKTYENETALRPIRLDPVIREEIARRPDITIHYEGTGAVVLADDLLGEVFANLIINSRNHGGAETEVWIRVRKEEDGIEVIVEDNGPGIPDTLKPKVFERFTRGQSRSPGTGLGLHICRSLVTWYGGAIRAEDRLAGHPEGGASIRFTLNDLPP
ncbi:sensor histidine kinase [Methanofollis fontis]|nr:HAMP domain-containing sensor histidine kinase [Methanofollis fontis]